MSFQRPRTRIGQIDIDVIPFSDALDEIENLVIARGGGTVFTPNVDHVVNAEYHAAFRHAYHCADLSLVDGQPLVWASRLIGAPLPEKISGSDLVLPLLLRAAKRRWRVYLLGAGPGVAEKAAQLLQREYDVNVVGVDAPLIQVADTSKNTQIISSIRDANPDLVLVALGSPKQELFIHQIASEVKPAVLLGIGASLDFIVGAVKRAPKWMSRSGLEWLYRLAKEPRRMWRRYLVNDSKFFAILVRDLIQARGRRTTSNTTPPN